MKKWRDDIKADRAALESAREKVTKITAKRDGKLLLLKKLLDKKAAIANPQNRKLLLFTVFGDTVKYLYEHLKETARKNGQTIVYVTGSETSEGSGSNAFQELLDRFSPRVRGASIAEGKEIDILLATDCISEGQNLHDCDTVLNYDIHWNPVRLIQRFGRIDRLGSEHDSVQMINYWPTDDMELYLNLENRVRSRMALVDISATGTEDILEEQEKIMRSEVEFHNNHVLQIRDAVIDLEETEDIVTLSELTLDKFIDQLWNYLRIKRKEFDQAPPGIYAVADAASANKRRSAKDALQNGAIFLFRRENTPKDSVALSARKNLPQLYLIHVEQHRTRSGHLNLRETLQTFEALALGQTEPIAELCDQFTAEIEATAEKSFYDKLAQNAVNDIARVANSKAQEALKNGARQKALLPKKSAYPTAENLELIAWLVIKHPPDASAMNPADYRK